MAKTKPNAALKEIRGRIDGFVYRQMEGKVIMSRRPRHKENRRRSDAEKATQERMSLAGKWAKAVPADRIPLYDRRAKEDGIPKIAARTRDFLTPPEIETVIHERYTGQAGQPIVVIAHDDFEVKDVTVTIRTADGREVEKGGAVRVSGDVWRYESKRAVPADTPWRIEVVARDWPDHKARWTWPPLEGPPTAECPVANATRLAALANPPA